MDKRHRRWTEEEKGILREAWESCHGLFGLPERLKRSRAAIVQMAGKLGLGPALHNSDRITQTELIHTLYGRRSLDGRSCRARIARWEKAGLKVTRVRVNAFYHRMVCIEDFWRWAEGHQELVCFKDLEPNGLGPEPDWVEGKRQRDFENRAARFHAKWSKAEYRSLLYNMNVLRLQGAELERRMGRSLNSINYQLRKQGNPLRAAQGRTGQARWTVAEEQLLVDCILHGYDFEYIADQLNRSVVGVKHHCLYHYKSERLEELRVVLQERGNSRLERVLQERAERSRERLVENEKQKERMAALVKGCARRAARRRAGK